MGFPTANLEVEQELLPPRGVYAALVPLGEKRYPSAVNIGKRPTFKEEDFQVEVFIMDYQGELYGREITVGLLERLRPERAFSSPSELIQQISKDIERVKEIASRGGT